MSQDQPGTPMIGNRPRGEFFSRLWYYFIGVAIGCVLVGLLLAARAKQKQQQSGPESPQDNSVKSPTSRE